MKTALKIISFLLIFIILIFELLLAVPDEFEESYQRVLVRQYDYLNSIEGNKIVFVGSSSLAFGFDMDEMEDLTGLPCPMLGNHVSVGMQYLLELVKANVIPGDKVVIEYFNSAGNNTGAAELILTGIGKRYDMHRFFPKDMYGVFIKTIPSYVRKNLGYWREGAPYSPYIPYCVSSFDERGNMTLPRPDTWLSEEYITHEADDSSELQYHDYYRLIRNLNYDVFDYINKYTEYFENMGVEVFITLQPVYDDSIPDYCTDEVMEEYDSILSEHLKAPLISTSKENILPREYFFDSYLHPNTPGAELRTKMLYEDLKEYL